VQYAQRLLDEIGVDGRRLKMIHLSSAMGKQFAEEATRMTEEVRALGPNPLKNGRIPGGHLEEQSS
jgi:coenzyme F420-reducing hydrogenase delta subunit